MSSESVKEIPPHPLDSAFKSPVQKDIFDSLLNNEKFLSAVEKAIKKYNDTPTGIAGPSKQRAARQAFLEELTLA